MLNNTYDIKANRFGILFCDDTFYNSKVREEIDEVIAKTNINHQTAAMLAEIGLRRNGSIIEFSEVDGLKIKDLQAFDEINDEFISFVIYDLIKGINNSAQEQKFMNIKENIIFVISNDDKDKSIDDYISNYFIDNYHTFDDERKKYVKCFLQRYKYGSVDLTDEAIYANAKINTKKNDSKI